MTTCSSISEALALHCAVCFAAQSSASWMQPLREIVFRAGPLLPSDLFATPSFREGIDYVTVLPEKTGFENLAMPLGSEWSTDVTITPCISLQQGDRVITVTINSIHAIPGIAAIFWDCGNGKRVNARHVVQPDQTAEEVAVALATQIPGVLVRGDTLTVPVGRFFGRVAGYSRTVRPLRRQKQTFRLSVRSSDRKRRDALGDFLATSVFSGDWLTLLDGQRVQVILQGETIEDATQMENLFRRDLCLSVIADRYEARWSPQMIAGGGIIEDGGRASLFDDEPGPASGSIPFAALDALMAEQSLPEPYRHWYCDLFGTVQRRAESETCIPVPGR